MTNLLTDTTAGWLTNDPVLLAGQLGYETDGDHGLKVGDGTTAWTGLPYVGGATPSDQTLPPAQALDDDMLTLTEDGTWVAKAELPAASVAVPVSETSTADLFTVLTVMWGMITNPPPPGAVPGLVEAWVGLGLYPTWEVGDEEVVVTNTERHTADLDYWIDGIVGFADLDGTITGFAPNGPKNARWTSTPADFLGTVEATDVEIEADVTFPDVGYAAGGPIYHDVAGGRLLKIYHGERYPFGVADGTFWSFLGLAVAPETDPDDWTDLGAIITPERAFVANTDCHAEVTGGPYVIDPDGNMLVYFKDTDPNGIWKGLCVARCPLADVLAAVDEDEAPMFHKRLDGEWTSPAIGGEADDLLPGVDPNPWWFDIVHLVQRDEYLMVYTAPEDGDVTSEGEGFAMWARTALDPVTWGPAQRLTDPEPVEVIYPSLSSPSLLPQWAIAGDEVVVTYVNSVSGWPFDQVNWNRWANATVRQRTLRYTARVVGGAPAPEPWVEVDEADFLNGWEYAGPHTTPFRYRRHAGTLWVDTPAIVGGATGAPVVVLPEGYRVEAQEEVVTWFTEDGTSFVPGAFVLGGDGGVRPYYVDPTRPAMISTRITARLPTG